MVRTRCRQQRKRPHTSLKKASATRNSTVIKCWGGWGTWYAGALEYVNDPSRWGITPRDRFTAYANTYISQPNHAEAYHLSCSCFVFRMASLCHFCFSTVSVDCAMRRRAAYEWFEPAAEGSEKGHIPTLRLQTMREACVNTAMPQWTMSS